MSLRPRPNTFSHYRLCFAITFLALGCIALAMVAMDSLASPSLFLFFADDASAVVKSLAIGGGLSLIYALVMFELITDRRTTRPDRRQSQLYIDFLDRRSTVDRRAQPARNSCEDSEDRVSHAL